MSSSFFNYIQPTIVRASNTSKIPDELKNQYLINLNVVGIEYFEQLFLLIQRTDGIGYDYMLTNTGDKIRINEIVDQIDIPRIYLKISDKITKDDTAFKNFLLLALSNDEIYYNGTEDFIPGVDYWVNETLYKYLVDNESQFCDEDLNRILPNYLNSDFEITEHWQTIPEELKYYVNFKYFQNKNWLLANNTYSEDELNNFYSTFCKTILDQSLISSDKLFENTNQIYQRTLQYYINFMNDSVLAGINIILGTKYKSLDSNVTTCGCQSYSSDLLNSLGCMSAYDTYKSAISEYLKQMLGDTIFYKDWMYITNGDEYFPNDGLIENLIRLVTEFENLNYDLSFRQDKPVYGNKCVNIEDANNTANHCIIQNYLKVLNWVLNKEIDENKNKIKVYGEKFAELLPKLQF